MTSQTLLLTQPLITDCFCTEREVVDIYGPIIKKYMTVLIKPHPRDVFPYEKYFSSVKVLRTKMPMQILTYMGYIPDRVITISSSAISAFSPDSTEIIWLGTDIHPKVRQFWGNIKEPQFINNSIKKK